MASERKDSCPGLVQHSFLSLTCSQGHRWDTLPCRFYIYISFILSTQVLQIPLLENNTLPAILGVNICDSGEPGKNRKPRVLTGVVHWFVVDPRWPPDKLAQEKIITLIYHWGLALFKGNNHLAEQVPLQGLIDPGGRQSLGCGASPQKRSPS